MHYTSASGLHGIVTSKTLWASHTSFLNDSEEAVGFLDRVLPMILRSELERHVPTLNVLSRMFKTDASWESIYSTIG